MTYALATAIEYVNAPLIYKGKVRELYDLGDQMLIVVTDRISAFDYVLDPAVPDKGNILNQMSQSWFYLTNKIVKNHFIHSDIDLIEHIVTDKDKLRNRIMVVQKAVRIPVECVVRGYVTGNCWRQYEASGMVNGHKLPDGLRKNQQLPTPVFTPAKKNDVGHDEDVSLESMSEWLGEKLTQELQNLSLKLYTFASKYCEQRGIILADTKFEFGIINDEVILIDEILTPDSSRFWSKENYAWDIEIESLDKEPVRSYLANSDWDKLTPPPSLPGSVILNTSKLYKEILARLFE